MDISHFIAQALGVYFIIAALFYAARGSSLESIISDYFDSPGQVFLGGAITLILGILIVLGHPYWEANWKGVITLLGCLLIFKGIMHWFFPTYAALMATKFINGRWYAYGAGITFLIGVFFCYIGFFV